MSNHTPGPWKLDQFDEGDWEPWFRVSAENTLNLEIVPCADGYVPGANEANARLIASAPDMFNELTRLRASHAELLAACEAYVSMRSQNSWDESQEQAVEDMVKQTIAHATEAPP